MQSVPTEYRGQWTLTASSYDVSPDESFCYPQEVAVPFNNLMNVYVNSVSVQWGGSGRPYTDANLGSQDGGVLHFVALRSEPAYSETTDYAVAFESATYGTVTITRLRDYFYRQCVVHWYGSIGRG